MRAAIFASAGKGIGYGHYGRCRALKEGFAEKNIEADLYLHGSFDSALTGDDAISADWIKDSGTAKGYDVCIIDSYLTSGDDLRKIAAVCPLCVFIDDFMRLDYPDGIVLNGSVYAEELPYPDKPSQMLLAGVKYSMLRKPFWDFDDYAVERSGIFLSAGGSGAEKLTESICRLLLDGTDEDIFVVGRNIGIKSGRVHTLFGLSASEMAELMSKRLFAVSAAGQTSYELARTAVPSVLFAFAENQRVNLVGWEKSGFALSAGFADTNLFKPSLQEAVKKIREPEQNQRMSAMGPLYVDGQGVRRAVKIITEVAD